MNIYLDIDGTLLAHEQGAANFADDFLQFVLNHFPDTTFWLTTHCWRHENRAVEVLAPFLKTKTARLIEKVKPTDWGTYKTDGIDFGKPFFWYDDTLYQEEEAILKHRGALECFRRIDLSQDPNQLIDEIQRLKQYI
jgi:hypothetical protein